MLGSIIQERNQQSQGNQDMTELKYLEDTEMFQSEAIVTSFDPETPTGSVMVLNQTIFYPQGGGQPTDTGTISEDAASFDVSRVSFRDGVVYHAGTMTKGAFQAGDKVHLAIDGDRRMRHAKLHTGGHLVMTAVDRLLHLPAVKGYHFPDGPYVEFIGTTGTEGREQLLADIQTVLDKLVAEDSAVTSQFITVEELQEQGIYVPAEIPAGKPTRVVITSGYKSPCGGTHVKRLGELSGLRAKAIKSKSGNTRVSYYIEGV